MTMPGDTSDAEMRCRNEIASPYQRQLPPYQPPDIPPHKEYPPMNHTTHTPPPLCPGATHKNRKRLPEQSLKTPLNSSSEQTAPPMIQADVLRAKQLKDSANSLTNN
ncbi:hypothetical protein ACSYAD_30960 [Acaryochloris marina NIES-2412]|uniref:hypothetical protein n=1 Tax=Acaryochloris marina TaxID=155978 RepID=UPI00405A489E